MSYYGGYYDYDDRTGVCALCKDPRTLTGFSWNDPTTNAYFAINILTALVLLASLGLVPLFKWTRVQGGTGLRNAGFVIAAATAFIVILLQLVDTGLREAAVTTTQAYYIIYPIEDGLQRISELVILGLILYFICENITTSRAGVISALNAIAILILACLSAAGWAMFTSQVAIFLNNVGNDSTSQVNLVLDLPDVNLAYESLYLVIVFWIIAMAVLAVTRGRTRENLLMLCWVVPCLLIRTVFNLAYDALLVSFYNNPFEETTADDNFYYANDFAYSIFTAAVFLGVAVVAYMRPQTTRAQEYKV